MAVLATLRRWYLVIVSAFGLGGAAWSAADLLYGIIQVIAVPAFGSIRGTTATAVSGLLAGLAVWLPNYRVGPTSATHAGAITRQRGALDPPASLRWLGDSGKFGCYAHRYGGLFTRSVAVDNG